MFDFTFVNPTKIIFGKGKIAAIAQEIPQEVKTLILYGGGSVKTNGTLEEVRTALAGRQVIEFGGIEPNPTFETLMKAVELARAEKIGFLLAVGGGSVIDGTKFVSAAIPFDGQPWDILARWAPIKAAVPFGSVLTLPATGSEMNCGAVITKAENQDKLVFQNPLVFPRFSVLDPTKTFSLPPRQIANGVVDAFTHVMEQYLTYPVHASVQDRFAEGLLLTLIEEGPKALKNPEDYDVRADIMWAATLGLNGLIGVGVPQDWTTHLLGHELTALFGIDHARTLALILPGTLTYKKEQKRAKLLQYGERVWGIIEGTDDQRVDAAINKTRDFFESLGIPTRLSLYDIGPEDIDRFVSQLERHQLTKLGEHGDIDLAASRKIFELCL